MEVDDPGWIDVRSNMLSTSPKKGWIKTEGMGLIVEVELNAEVLTDRKAIAENILRFDLIIILQLIY